MGGDCEWNGNGEEEAAEEAGAGLEIRQRRRVKVVNDVPAEKEEEERSVYLATDQGPWKCRHCTWTYHLIGPGIDHTQKHKGNCQVAMGAETLTQLQTYFELPTKGIEFKDVIAGVELRGADKVAAENSTNGISDVTIEELNNFENVLIEKGKELDNLAKEELTIYKNTPNEKERTILQNVIVETGLTSCISSEKINGNGIKGNGNRIEEYKQSEKSKGNGIMQHEGEIEEIGQPRPGKFHKIEVEEFDVERVLEEQETHDLFCPNCNSCITKRVILRKRKRTIRDNKHDLPPEKLQNVHGVIVTAPEPAEVGHEDKEVFRCLSCFSFFISADGGFNIFGIFGKREESKSLPSSAQVPVRTTNWVSSIFRPDKTKGTGAGPSLPHGSNILPEKNMGASSVNTRTPSTTTVSGADSLGGIQVSIDSHTFSSVNPSLEANQSTPTENIKGPTELTESHITITKDDAGDGIEKPNVVAEPLFPAETFEVTPRLNGFVVVPSALSKPLGDGIEKPNVEKPNVVAEPLFPGETFEVTPRLNGFVVVPSALSKPLGDDVTEPIGMVKPSTQSSEIIHDSVPSAAAETLIDVDEQAVQPGRNNEWDVLKSIVYGGLIESIASLGVVSSAAGAAASTLNIVALGLANLVGGLFVIAHNISELRSTQEPEATNQTDKPADRYWELLGRRDHFRRHMIVAILSYIVFGLLPPVIYGFAFRKSDNKEYKLIAVAAASLLCIALLAIGKAHVKLQKDYIKCLAYYITLGVSASGLSYVAGVFIDKLLVEIGIFDQNASTSPSPPSALGFRGIGSGSSATWASL